MHSFHPLLPSSKRSALRVLLAIATVPALGFLVPAAASAAITVPSGFSAETFATAPTSSPATVGPDDIAQLGDHVFVGWQNGIPATGGANPGTGQTTSTIVEYSRDGQTLNSWNITGKADGLGGDPAHDRLIVTANEDGNSTLYTITPSAPPSDQVRNYVYSPAPDSASSGGVLTGGGTDAVSVYRGEIYLSASNPTPADATAVFHVELSHHGGTPTATLEPTFADNAMATDAVSGQPVQLGLTDPDSNAVVPDSSPRFGGQFVLDGQADQQLVFARTDGWSDSLGSADLTRLPLNHGGTPAGVDDVRWTQDENGTLYVVDNGANAVYAITGPFAEGQAFASLDTVGSVATNTEVDSLDLQTGALTQFAGGLVKAKGLLWMPGERPHEGGDGGESGGDGGGGSGGEGGGNGGGGGEGGGGEHHHRHHHHHHHRHHDRGEGGGWRRHQG